MKFNEPATTNPIDQLKVVGQPIDRVDDGGSRAGGLRDRRGRGRGERGEREEREERAGRHRWHRLERDARDACDGLAEAAPPKLAPPRGAGKPTPVAAVRGQGAVTTPVDRPPARRAARSAA